MMNQDWALLCKNLTNEDGIRAALNHICGDEDLRFRFLNTLSYLEHMGSRKLLISCSESDTDEDFLRHVNEEARHALFLKRQAQKLSTGPLRYARDQVLGKYAAFTYFNRLDRMIGKNVNFAMPLHSIYVAAAVEVRALWFYPVFQDALDGADLKISMAGILAEEHLHIEGLTEKLRALDPDRFEERMAECIRIECALFERFFQSLSRYYVKAAKMITPPRPKSSHLEASLA